MTFAQAARCARLAILCFTLMLAGPALAHGDETHETDAGAEIVVTPDRAATIPAMDATPTEAGAVPSLLTIFTNLHPATTHFAIALFVVAAILMAVTTRRPSRDLDASVRVLVITGGAGAVLAAIFGWIHTGLWFGGEGVMQVHRWLGTGLALVGAGMAIALLRRPRNLTALKLVVFVIAALVLVQGYLGAELGHGAGHLWAQH